MSRRHYSSSAAATTLTSSVGSSDTTIVVGSITGLPVQFPYTLILDPDTASEEVVDVTAGGGTTLTITRGVDGTTAVAHTAGAVVQHGVSARDFDEPNSHVNASTGVHSVSGSVVGTSDAQTLTNKTISGGSNTLSNIPTSALAASIPLGKLGYAEVTANQTPITTNADLTGLSSSVTVGTSRRIRITGYVSAVGSTVATDFIIMRIQEGATTLEYGGMVSSAGTNLLVQVVIAPTAGSHTYKLTMERNSGTGIVQMSAAAANPAWILVEDIGAA